jgi:hypothetical protein
VKSERKCSWTERIWIGSILGIILFVIILSINSSSAILLAQTAGFAALATAWILSAVQAPTPCIDLGRFFDDRVDSKREVGSFLNQIESPLRTTPSSTRSNKNSSNQTEDNFFDSSHLRDIVLSHKTPARLGSYQEVNLFPVVQPFGNK